jgi:hypothetical protein
MRSSEWSSYVVAVLGLEGRVDPSQLVRQWEDNLTARMPSVALMPGASEAIAFFTARGIPMAIATSSSPASVAAKRAAHPSVRQPSPPPPSPPPLNPPPQMFSSMAHVLTSADVLCGKPSPDIFLAAAHRLGVSPTACIVFEDSPHGVTAGVHPRPCCPPLALHHTQRALLPWRAPPSPAPPSTPPPPYSTLAVTFSPPSSPPSPPYTRPPPPPYTRPPPPTKTHKPPPCTFFKCC